MGSIRDGILGADDLPREKLETPEWEPDVPFVWVRGLTGAERDKWDSSLMERGRDGNRVAKLGGKDVRAKFCTMVLVDEEGKQIFALAEAPLLGKKSAVVIERIWRLGRELSGMQNVGDVGDDDDEEGQENPSEEDESSSSESL